MFNIFNQKNFSTKLFISISIGALILLSVCIFIIKSILIEEKNIQFNVQANQEEIYYDTTDPFITKVITIDDLITEPIISDNDPSLGAPDAPVTIVVFSDFECKFCQEQEKVIKEILEEFKNKIRFIWKDYPLPSSLQASVAARCANEQNQFWQYHDLLFENSDNLNNETFLRIADKLSLDIDNFKECLNKDDIKDFVANNVEEANALDITGVPFTYINNMGYMGEISFEELKNLIEIELKKQKNVIK